MSGSRTFTFTDPHPYRTNFQGADIEVLITTRGDFRTEVTQIDLSQLWMQRAREAPATRGESNCSVANLNAG